MSINSILKQNWWLELHFKVVLQSPKKSENYLLRSPALIGLRHLMSGYEWFKFSFLNLFRNPLIKRNDCSSNWFSLENILNFLRTEDQSQSHIYLFLWSTAHHSLWLSVSYQTCWRHLFERKLGEVTQRRFVTVEVTNSNVRQTKIKDKFKWKTNSNER